MGLSLHPIAVAAVAVFGAYLATCLVSFIRVRRHFGKLPGPPHHPIFGHLISMGKVVTRLPKRVHPHVYPYFLTKEYNLPPVFYIDAYPFNDPLMVLLDPDTAQEVSANSGLHKHPRLKSSLDPLAGRENLVSSDGPRWKKWRTVFNPGFSIQHLMDQVPAIVDCAQTFSDILNKHASARKVFRLEEEATKVTIDVIGKVVCDHDFRSLVSDNEFVALMRKTLSWMPDTQSLDPFHKNHPLRGIYWRYYKHRMDNYIGKILDERFSKRGDNEPSKAKMRSGIDLALHEYFKETGQDVDSKSATMDAEFRRNAIDNLEVLLFAGHDTTASTICYCYHLLNKNPSKLEKLREELDAVFGPGASAAEQIKAAPYLINKCEYTLAVIREALRLYAPASSVREGRKDYFIRDPATGNMLPTEGCIVWPAIISIHRDPRIWGEDAHEFQPERFLPENVGKMDPNAYRPFEKGPRNCIGQELALIEMKVILAMTVRELDIKSAYDELSTLDQDNTLWAAEKSFKGGVQECFGDEAYQVLLAAAKPREGMPARAMRRNL
ncbi:putative P450 monooxygenase [Lojkania enalia]|uniref:P450 monooxygenase n=1 Tax=Lojkania enalia TaxID=147567 RepID=A0A9P4NDC3_9PLEO|nr:putative P450 monooxygenase [Didymosphaeria enalia]